MRVHAPARARMFARAHICARACKRARVCVFAGAASPVIYALAMPEVLPLCVRVRVRVRGGQDHDDVEDSAGEEEREELEFN